MMRVEKKKKNRQMLILPVYIMISLPSWTKFSCQHYHFQREIAAWQKKFGPFYEYIRTTVDTGKIQCI